MPSSRNRASTGRARSSSPCDMTWALRWTSVTRVPIRWKNCASSRATGPPPSTIMDRGTSRSSRASSLVRYPTSSSPEIGTWETTEPVEIMNALAVSLWEPARTSWGERNAARSSYKVKRESFSAWMRSSANSSMRRALRLMMAERSALAETGCNPNSSARFMRDMTSEDRRIVLVGMHPRKCRVLPTDHGR